MELDTVQELDEDVAGDPGPMTVKLVEGCLWNFYYLKVSIWSLELYSCVNGSFSNEDFSKKQL